MVTDQEPRYRLVDADGSVVGSLFAESDGTLKLQEGTSGNDNELSLTTQGALEVEQLASERHIAGSYPGSDPDARLDNALSAASFGETIFLEKATYDASRTISKQVALKGAGLQSTRFTNGLTLDARCLVENINSISTLTIKSDQCVAAGVSNFKSSVVINANEVILSRVRLGSVTFNSGTSGSVIDSSISVAVTDNGNNLIGDVS